MKILIRASILLLILLLTNSSVLAKSLDVANFNKLWKQAHKLKEEGKKNESNDIFYSIGEDFDIDNMNTTDVNKGSYYFWICTAIRSINYQRTTDRRRRDVILYCSKSYNYYKKANEFKNRKILQAAIASGLGTAHMQEFTLHGGEKHIKLAEKYLLITFNNSKIIKDEVQKQRLGIKALKGLIDLYRHKQNLEKAVNYQREVISFYKCTNKDIAKDEQELCNEQKYNLAHILSLQGKKNEAIKIYKEVIKKESDLTKPIDKALTRLALYNEYIYAGDYDLAEKYIYESISFLNPENPDHKITYYWHLEHLYYFFYFKGFFHESTKGYLNLLKDMEKDFGKNSVQLISVLSSLGNNYLNEKTFILEYGG